MVAELSSEDRSVVEDVVVEVAPEELAFARELIAPPTWRSRFRGEAIGYGIGSELAVVAPYAVLLVAWARAIVTDEAKSVTEQRLRSLTRRVLGVRDKTMAVPPARPSTAARDELLAATKSYAVILGMAPRDAETLAQAVVKRVLPD